LDIFTSVISFNKDVIQSAARVQKNAFNLQLCDVANMKKFESTKK